MWQDVLFGLGVFVLVSAAGLALLFFASSFGARRRAKKTQGLLARVLTYVPEISSVRAWSEEDRARAELWALGELGQGAKKEMPFCVVALGYAQSIRRGFSSAEPDDAAEIPARTTVCVDQPAVRAHG